MYQIGHRIEQLLNPLLVYWGTVYLTDTCKVTQFHYEVCNINKIVRKFYSTNKGFWTELYHYIVLSHDILFWFWAKLSSASFILGLHMTHLVVVVAEVSSKHSFSMPQISWILYHFLLMASLSLQHLKAELLEAITFKIALFLKTGKKCHHQPLQTII